MVVDRRYQGVPLLRQPVNRPLGLAHQVDEPRGVAPTDFTATRNAVRGCQQQARQQADHGHAEPPGGPACLLHVLISKNSWLGCSYVRLVLTSSHSDGRT